MDISIRTFSVLSSTSTTLNARWTILSNTSDIIMWYIFSFQSGISGVFEYNLTRQSVTEFQNGTFEYNFMDIPNSQPYTVTTMLVTNTNAFTSVFSIGECK